MLQWICILAELFLIWVFTVPFFLHICNAGNLAGLLTAVCLLMVTIFISPVMRFLSEKWQLSGGKILLLTGGVLLAAGILVTSFFSVQMLRAYQNPPEQPCTVVVLGCKVKGTTPSLMLQRRLDAAYTYLQNHPECLCIVSGGQGADEQIPEAQAMYTYLTERGIPGERLLMEDASTNTAENLRFSKKILEEKGLPLEIVIVTDGFHQYRAGLLAKAEGLKSWSVSGKTRTVLIPTYWVREWLALLRLAL